MQFEWDEKKRKINLKEHKIDFDVVISVFKENRCKLKRWDKRGYEGEEREITIGMIDDGRIVVVVHVDRGENIRIISARKATQKERKIY